MASVNKAIIMGRVGSDPEVRRTQNGKAIANLSLATSEKWNDKTTGEKKEKTEWHRVVVFGGLADVVDKYVKKGDMLYFEGKIQTREWTDKDNAKRYSTEIIVDMGGVMQMLGGNTQAPKPLPTDTGEPFDTDVPF